ncbi:HNH/ENDO VII family nuclease [Pseudidiomarina sediminum]|uniref:HNH/ENDO VII family nuclease n=1 Tax=Pseudidiomarina sediminum TaxID=431675 RepID=UPI001C93B896|nr:HNH/ENDO VII family nuclease [Pseudidiomarina sediminum]MBY6062825.1 HNH/ENDO VII family nuclease [Pseudidiomarina sediminum]
MNNPLAGTDPSGYLWCGAGSLEKAACGNEQKQKRRDAGSVGRRAAETIWINGGPAVTNGARHSPRSAATGELEREAIGGPGEVGANQSQDPSLGQQATSLGLDVVPVVGSAKSFMQMITDAVTGEEVHRGMEFLGIFAGLVPGGKALLKGDKIMDLGQASIKSLRQSRSFWKSSVTFKGNKVFQRTDLIDPKLIDGRGRTNLQRMQKGLAPIGPDGKSMNLHHMTQRQQGSIAEMTQSFHEGNHNTIHINPSSIPSGINRTEFNNWRSYYWKNRASDF